MFKSTRPEMDVLLQKELLRFTRSSMHLLAIIVFTQNALSSIGLLPVEVALGINNIVTQD